MVIKDGILYKYYMNIYNCCEYKQSRKYFNTIGIKETFSKCTYFIIHWRKIIKFNKKCIARTVF